MTFLRSFLTEFSRNGRGRRDLLHAFTFFLIFLGLLHFFEALTQGVLPILIWIFVSLLLSQAHMHLFQEDFDSGTLEILYTTPPFFDRYLCVKLLSQVIFLGSVGFLIIGTFIILQTLPTSFGVALGLALPPFILTSSLLSALLLNGRGQTLMPLLSLPLFFPILLLGLLATTAEPQEAALALKILGALSFFTTPLLYIGIRKTLIEKLMSV